MRLDRCPSLSFNGNRPLRDRVSLNRVNPPCAPCAQARSAQSAASSRLRRSARNAPPHQSRNAAGGGRCLPSFSNPLSPTSPPVAGLRTQRQANGDHQSMGGSRDSSATHRGAAKSHVTCRRDATSQQAHNRFPKQCANHDSAGFQANAPDANRPSAPAARQRSAKHAFV